MEANWDAQDPWGLLGLEEGAPGSEIKLAYTRLIRKYRAETHPREFKILRRAYEDLTSQPESRVPLEIWEYPTPRESPPQGRPPVADVVREGATDLQWMDLLEKGHCEELLKDLSVLVLNHQLDSPWVYKIMKILSVTVLSHFHESEELYRGLLSLYPWIPETPAEEVYQNRAMLYKDFQKWLLTNPPSSLVSLLRLSSVFPVDSTRKNFSHFLSDLELEPGNLLLWMGNIKKHALSDLYTAMLKTNRETLEVIWTGTISDRSKAKAEYYRGNGKLAKNTLLGLSEFLAFLGLIRLFFLNWILGLTGVIPFLIYMVIIHHIMGKRSTHVIHIPFYVETMVRDRVTFDQVVSWIQEKEKENTLYYALLPPSYMKSHVNGLLKLLDGSDVWISEEEDGPAVS